MAKMGSSSQDNQIDPVLRQYAMEGLQRANEISRLPYQPNRGIQYAAFTPMQEAAFDNTDGMAGAFGLSTSGGATGLPEAETTEEGYRGFSTGGLFDDMVSKSITEPIQDLMGSMFYDPETGEAPAGMREIDESATNPKAGK